MTRFDAIVIGAGPAGGTAALKLARAGWSVAVVEKSQFPRRKVCGEFISATSLPLLYELGIGDAFVQSAGPEVQRVGLFVGETVLDAPMPRVSLPSGGWGRALGREHLDLMLLNEAVKAGATLWQPWNVSHVRRSADGHICTLTAKDSSQELSAPVIIMAGGSWQRDILSIDQERPHKVSDLLAFKAHFTGGNLPNDLMPLLAFPGGYGGMVHSDHGRTSVSCCIRRDELQRCRQLSNALQAAEAVFQHILTTTEGVQQALDSATLDGAWLSVGPIRPGIRSCYRDGIFQVGNAAGEAHPVVAEGISMAMQSSWILCQQLIAWKKDAADVHVLKDIGEAYAKEWKEWFSQRIHAAAVFANVAMRPNATGFLLPVFERFPQLLTHGAKLSGKSKQLPLAA